MVEPGRRAVRLLGVSGDPLTEYLRYALERAGVETQGADGAVLPRLGAETACRVWSGACGTPESQEVWDTLCRGRPVWTPWAEVEAQAREPEVWLAGLVNRGLLLCPLEDFGEWVARGEVISGAATACAVERAARRGTTRLFLAHRRLLTPLGRERAGALGMRWKGVWDEIGPGGRGGLGHPEK